MRDIVNDIKLLSLRRVDHAGSLRAYADVRVNDITICDCRLIQQVGQRAYLSGPQKQVGDRWIPLVKMPTALREEVQRVVLLEAERDGVVDKPAQPDLLTEQL